MTTQPETEAWLATPGPSAGPVRRDGVTVAARALCAGLPPLRPGEPCRWRPLPGEAGLELLDRQGRPLGWRLVPAPVWSATPGDDAPGNL